MRMKDNYLPTDSRYYVYLHTDPISNEVVYVGMGQKGRAWAITNSGGESPMYGNRSGEHYEWFVNLEGQGFTLLDIVDLVGKGLTKSEALELERDFIEELKPIFNRVAGLNNLKITQDDYDAALLMREDGLSYLNIGKELGLSTMTIYRALNGKTKNMGN